MFDETAAATKSSNSNGTMIPPADEEVAALTTSGSMTGSAIPPAKAVAAERVRAEARRSFFIIISFLKRGSASGDLNTT